MEPENFLVIQTVLQCIALQDAKSDDKMRINKTNSGDGEGDGTLCRMSDRHFSNSAQSVWISKQTVIIMDGGTVCVF